LTDEIVAGLLRDPRVLVRSETMRISPLARVVLVMAATQSCVCGQSHMTVAVYNYAGTPDSVLLPAVDMARRALLVSRVPSRWVICGPEGCRERISPGSYLELIVLPRLQPTEGVPAGHPAGFAFQGPLARRAYASYASAQQVSAWKLRPVELVLACILIHETGHLLGLRHQAHGAMRASLEGEDMDEVVRGRAFTAAEGDQLRRAVAPRGELRAGVP
jgi:hypothetical protein